MLSLTDHDTLDGIAEAAQALAALDLSLIPGVEISVTWSRMTIHVLGLNVQPDNPALRADLQGCRNFATGAPSEIARKLETGRYRRGAGGRASSFRKGNILSRTHFAHFLVQVGRAASLQEVFKRFLVKGKPGYVAAPGPRCRRRWTDPPAGWTGGHCAPGALSS